MMIDESKSRALVFKSVNQCNQWSKILPKFLGVQNLIRAADYLTAARICSVSICTSFSASGSSLALLVGAENEAGCDAEKERVADLAEEDFGLGNHASRWLDTGDGEGGAVRRMRKNLCKCSPSKF